MDRKDVILDNPGRGQVGTFSVGDVSNIDYDKKVTICVARDGIDITANFFFKRRVHPRTCKALDALEEALLEEGAAEVPIS